MFFSIWFILGFIAAGFSAAESADKKPGGFCRLAKKPFCALLFLRSEHLASA